MTISVGDKLPEATLLQMGGKGPEQVDLDDKTKGRKVVIFAVPGAFTPTCHSAHVPSFIQSMDDLKAKGVDEVICVAGNDPFVMQAWGEATGADKAGITMLSDASGAFSEALGLNFSAPPAGLYNRASRFALAAEDGVVTVLNVEENGGTCDISGGPTMVDAL
ncbi:redoxin family protein [Aquicoccus sp. SCR17]|nr:redoxin family protein [Carideicomes alvinocaridis]